GGAHRAGDVDEQDDGTVVRRRRGGRAAAEAEDRAAAEGGVRACAGGEEDDGDQCDPKPPTAATAPRLCEQRLELAGLRRPARRRRDRHQTPSDRIMMKLVLL